MNDLHGEFLKLFLKHNSALYAFILARGVRPDRADDLLQNSAAVLWGKFREYQPGTNFLAWAFSVARLEILKSLDKDRVQARVLRLDEETLRGLETLEVEQGDRVLDDRKDILVGCLKKLGETAGKLIRLRFGDALPFEDIARRLSLTSAAARVKVCRIMKALRDCVGVSLGGTQA